MQCINAGNSAVKSALDSIISTSRIQAAPSTGKAAKIDDVQVSQMARSPPVMEYLPEPDAAVLHVTSTWDWCLYIFTT